MRFWRRNVPNEPTPDADTLPPATEREAVHPQPEPAASPAPASDAAMEAERPRGWFGWRRGATEPVTTQEPAEPPAPVPETAEPETAEAADPEPVEPEAAELEIAE